MRSKNTQWQVLVSSDSMFYLDNMSHRDHIPLHWKARWLVNTYFFFIVWMNYKIVLWNLQLMSFECVVQKYICPAFNQPVKFWLGYEIHLCVWLFWCVFMSANASGTSVRERADARACVFAAAVQGCSKHAGKPVTANQARGNHPSAQRREPTIPHFLCLSPFLHYSLDLFFSLSHAHLYHSTSPVFFQFYENVTLWFKEFRNKVFCILGTLTAKAPFLFLSPVLHCLW